MSLRSQETEPSVWEQGFNAIGEHLAGIKRPCDYKVLLSDDPVIFLGESHSNTAIHEEIRSNADNLRSAGVTTVLVEAPDTKIQKRLFDRINSGDFSRIKKTNLGPLSMSKTARTQMVKSLHHAGIEILPIDDPRRYEGAIRYKEDDAESELYISERIKEIVRKKRGRSAVLFGMAHATRGRGSAVDLVEEKGIKCRTIFFIGGSEEIPIMVTESAKRVGISGEKFAFQAHESNGPFGGRADWIVHLPQVK